MDFAEEVLERSGSSSPKNVELIESEDVVDRDDLPVPVVEGAGTSPVSA